jgi:hypothetical protein
MNECTDWPVVLTLDLLKGTVAIFTPIMFILWHLWQRWWHGARGRVIILPPKAYATLADRTRKEAEAEGMGDVRLSTGDILVVF